MINGEKSYRLKLIISGKAHAAGVDLVITVHAPGTPEMSKSLLIFYIKSKEKRFYLCHGIGNDLNKLLKKHGMNARTSIPIA